ncbi:MAG TPA: ATP-binding protein [Candidatus Sulfotelmatobacter sp.]|jgi:signal transduction histidine kinase|nr:ATP-binding protein [Candidatus Sulfotelmatobacter sp.]
MPFTSDTGLKPAYHARRIALAMVLAMAVLVGLQLHRDYRSAIEQGERLVDAVANAAGQHLSGSIRAVHSLLEEAADGADGGRWDAPEFIDHLTTRLREFPEIRFICLIDKDGQLRRRTIPFRPLPPGGVDVSDRGYFQHQKENAGQSDIWVGDPTMGRLTHERTIHMSHPLTAGNGEFNGTVMAAVSPDGYADFLNSIMLEPEGGAAVIRLDGSFLARAPNHAEKFGVNIADSDLFTKAIPNAPQGVIRLVSMADGHDKLLGYRVMDDYDLVVTSGLSVDTALHDWRQMAWVESIMVPFFAWAMLYWAWQADLKQARSARARSLLEEMVAERTSQLAQSRELAEEHARRLQTVNEELRRLAQVTAHHLQEPVRPIVSYTQMARRKLNGSDHETDGWLQFVERSGLRLKALLRDFQRYASVLAEEPKIADTDADEALTLALARLRPLVKESEARIRREPLPWVAADRDMLAGVFLQLIDNAIRHRHPDRTPDIRVDVAETGAFWRISVIDNARGIDPKLAAKAFDAFERLGDNGTDSTGLGLAICRAVIQAHGGRIWIEPLPDGAIFHFTLPKGKSPEPPISPARRSGL